MKTIEQLAREAWLIEFIPESDIPKLQRFHSLAIAQYREGLLAVAYMSSRNGSVVTKAQRQSMQNNGEYNKPLHTADQMVAAVLREREACAQICDDLGYDTSHTCAIAIRRQR